MGPVTERERIVTLDVLRGFALCGVLISNLYVLYSGRWLGAAPETQTADVVARHAMSALVEGKAQNVLTFLFGFGFAAQLVRAEASGAPVAGLYVRRMLALFVIGWCHVALLWWGDVTWGYALSGFALLAFQRVGNVTRIVVGILLAVVPYVIWQHWKGGRWSAELVGITPEDWKAWSASLQRATRGGDYLEIVWNHVRYAVLFSSPIFTWYWPSLVGRFLLGYVAGAQGWFVREGADRLRLFRRMAVGGFVVGVPLAAFRVAENANLIDHEWHATPGAALYMIELLAMAAAYIAVVVLAMQRAPLARLLAILAPVGRMPLTMYVLQSVVCTSLFYGWGLGWAPPGAAACLGLALGIFAVEIGLAHLWLRRYRTGPLEHVWRRLVYLRRAPFRR